MTNKLLLITITSVSCLMMSCKNQQQKMRAEIETSEQKLKKDSVASPDKAKAADMIHLYSAYAEKFKDDSMSAEYLFRAADLSNGIHQPADAIVLLQRVQQYKTYSKTPVALFLQGFIAENDLHDMAKAKEYYEQFLIQYPNDKLANDVKITLSNLGKSPDELIKEFEAKAKGDSMKLSDEVTK